MTTTSARRSSGEAAIYVAWTTRRWTASSRNCWTPSVGDLDPHYSSGVGNHLFYLLGEGTGSKTIGGRAHNSTTCNGTDLVGIGRSAAVAIWYRALTTYWTSTTTYPQAANGMVRAAKDLYGADSSQCTATLNAWKGVNVTPTRTCGCLDALAGRRGTPIRRWYSSTRLSRRQLSGRHGPILSRC